MIRTLTTKTYEQIIVYHRKSGQEKSSKTLYDHNKNIQLGERKI